MTSHGFSWQKPPTNSFFHQVLQTPFPSAAQSAVVLHGVSDWSYRLKQIPVYGSGSFPGSHGTSGYTMGTHRPTSVSQTWPFAQSSWSWQRHCETFRLSNISAPSHRSARSSQLFSIIFMDRT